MTTCCTTYPNQRKPQERDQEQTPPSSSREQPGVDWSLVEDEYIKQVAQNAARAVGSRYRNVIEVDDLYQEALLILAQNPDTVRSYGTRRGKLYRWLWCDLTNLARRLAVQRNNEVSYELLRRGKE